MRPLRLGRLRRYMMAMVTEASKPRPARSTARGTPKHAREEPRARERYNLLSLATVPPEPRSSDALAKAQITRPSSPPHLDLPTTTAWPHDDEAQQFEVGDIRKPRQRANDRASSPRSPEPRRPTEPEPDSSSFDSTASTRAQRSRSITANAKDPPPGPAPPPLATAPHTDAPSTSPPEERHAKPGGSSSPPHGETYRATKQGEPSCSPASEHDGEIPSSTSIRTASRRRPKSPAMATTDGANKPERPALECSTFSRLSPRLPHDARTTAPLLAAATYGQ